MTRLQQLYVREIVLGELLISELEGTRYHEDLTLSIDRIRVQIRQFEFARINPIVINQAGGQYD